MAATHHTCLRRLLLRRPRQVQGQHSAREPHNKLRFAAHTAPSASCEISAHLCFSCLIEIMIVSIGVSYYSEDCEKKGKGHRPRAHKRGFVVQTAHASRSRSDLYKFLIFAFGSSWEVGMASFRSPAAEPCRTNYCGLVAVSGNAERCAEVREEPRRSQRDFQRKNRAAPARAHRAPARACCVACGDATVEHAAFVALELLRRHGPARIL